jgi:hypothetical protein
MNSLAEKAEPGMSSRHPFSEVRMFETSLGAFVTGMREAFK